MNIAIHKRVAQFVRITFRRPAVAEQAEDVGTVQEQVFQDVATMANWVVMHIPETERSLICLWIDGRPITGATLQATLLPLPTAHAIERPEVAP